MAEIKHTKKARPIHRCYAAIAALVIVAIIAATKFGFVPTDIPVDSCIFGCLLIVVHYGYFAATGRNYNCAETGLFASSDITTQPHPLFIAAKKYVNAEISLGEYALRTKDIMKGE